MRLGTLCLTTILAMVSMFATMQPASANDPKPPTVDRFRAYLIYEDTGELSKNKAKVADQIVANDEKGTSVQMLMDVVLTGPANTTYETPLYLIVVAHALGDKTGDPAMIDTGYPITFIGATGEAVRTLVVEHECEGYEIEAYVMAGDKRVSELKQRFNITCGD
jgi:hypothetical protein